MTTVDAQYAALVGDLIDSGDEIVTRNSKVKRLTARTMTFTSTPLVGVRKTAWRNSIREWVWFQSGSSDINDLHPSVRHWWQPWADSDGVVANNYSKQFRFACGAVWEPTTRQYELRRTDQIANFVAGVRDHPYSRRNLLTAWNAAEMVDQTTVITNCHSTVVQAFVGSDGLLSLVTYQRSVDVVCGLPHNLIQMAAFHLWLALQVGRRVGELTWIGGDCHLYEQHYSLAQQIVANVGRCSPTPVLTYTAEVGEDFDANAFSLQGAYKPVLTETAEMVV